MSRSTKALRALTVVFCTAAVIAISWHYAQDRRAPEPVFKAGKPAVRVAAVRLATISDRVEALGTTAAWQSIELRPVVSEIVRSLHFTDGQAVRRGDVLVELEQAEERARLAEAQAYLAEQERELRRITDLVARGLMARTELDARTTARDVARAQHAGAEAALADRTLRAPFDGTLGLRRVSPGALVGPETLITTLDDLGTLELDFTVPATRIGLLQVGTALVAVSPALGEREFAAEVVAVEPRLNPVERSLTARTRIDNTDGALKPGLLMQVRIEGRPHSALVVPEEAIIHFQRSHFVLLLSRDEDNLLVRREVVVGARTAGSVEIVSGLAEGDLVVVEGLNTAQPGQHAELLGIIDPEPSA